MNVICPEHVKTIQFDPEWRTEVAVRQTLVFLDKAERGTLRDVCAVPPDEDAHTFLWRSDDAIEVGRRKRSSDTIVVDWRPKEKVVPHALYQHQYSWCPTGSQGKMAFCIDLRCEMKTGLFECDIVATQELEAAIVFDPPRWRSLNSEAKMIKHALKQMETPGERPAIGDGGRRIEWKVMGPKVGARFILVAFRAHGVAVWQEQLRENSLFGRARKLLQVKA